MALQSDQDYLDSLREKRQQVTGARGVSFADQRLDFDLESLNAEIARLEQRLGKKPTTRYVASSKGLAG